MLVAGGSTASVVFTAAFLTGSGASVPGRGTIAGQRAVGRVLRLVERRDVEAALGGEAAAADRRDRSPRANARRSAGHEHFAFAGGDDVGERRQRLGVDERHRAADDDERMARRALGGVRAACRRGAAS